MATKRMLIGTIFDFFPPSLQQTVSLDFNGTNERMLDAVQRDHGFGNLWSWAAWVKPDQIAGDPQGDIFQQIMQIGVSEGTLGNSGAHFFMDNSASGRMKVQLANAAGAANKSFRWGGVFTIGEWTHVLITWDGTDLNGYFDGTFQAAGKQTDLALTMGSPNRITGIGRINAGSGFYWDGRIHSIAMWNVDVGAAASTIYNGGNGTGFNLAADSGSYTSSADLLHWWRLGFNSSNVGEDTGKASTLIDVPGVNISAADIVSDSPV